MGFALYTPPYSMPFVASPMREIAPLSPTLMENIAEFLMQSPTPPPLSDQLSQVRERFNEVVDTSTAWNVGVRRFGSFQTAPTPLVPPPISEEVVQGPSSKPREEWDLDSIFTAVHEERFNPITDIERGCAVELLRELVQDSTHPLSEFDPHASPDEEILVYQALEMLSTAAGSEASRIFRETLRSPKAPRPALFKALVGIQYANIFEAAREVIGVLNQIPPPKSTAASDPVRSAAIRTLGTVGHLGAFELLSKLIAGANLREQIASIEAAGNIALRVLTQRPKIQADEHSSRALRDGLLSWLAAEMEQIAFSPRELPAVRTQALIALGKVGNEEHLQPMLQLLQQFIDGIPSQGIDQQDHVQDLEALFKGVIMGLGYLGDVRADAALATIARDREWNDDLRLEALEALYYLESETALYALDEIARNAEDPLHEEAAQFLRDLEFDMRDVEEDDDFDLG